MRRSGQLIPDDAHHVECVGQALSLMVSAKVHLESVLDQQQGIESVSNTFDDGSEVLLMHRFTVYVGEHVEVRLHLFPDASETYIHNHRGNIISMCMAGSYEHTVWHATPVDVAGSPPDGAAATPPMYEVMFRDRGVFNRIGDPKPGRVTKKSVFTHEPPNVYFLTKESYHTVEVPRAAEGTTPKTLTIFVRDAKGAAPSTILRNCDPASDGDQPVASGPKHVGNKVTKLGREESLKIMAEMEAFLCSTKSLL